ncbi:type II secretion system protein [Thermus thermophilus]|uniref:type II secretion system protein n=1 Tax=Thermus thermophilus TaxID=274 RepID=UPI00191586A8|nr:type II secretion system protein [Thermus thermophilus]
MFKDNMSREGLSLTELLLVLALIALLVPSLLFITVAQARKTAYERSAQAYAQNVFRVAWAYLSEEPNHFLITGDCTTGYSAGNYSVSPPPRAVQACRVWDGGNGYPQVEVISITGKVFQLP